MWKLETKLFKSRLARRFFTMFIICALIPILALAALSYYRVSRQLTEQAYTRLGQLAKSHGVSIFERLVQVDQQLQLLQVLGAFEQKLSVADLPPPIGQKNQEIFTGLALIQNERLNSIWAEGLPTGWEKTVRQMAHLDVEVMLATLNDSAGDPIVIMVRRVENSTNVHTYLAATLNPFFLWGLENGTVLPAHIDFCVLDDQCNVLYTSLPTLGPLTKAFNFAKVDAASAYPKLTIFDEQYYAAHWSAFLKPQFHIPNWTILVVEPRSHIYQPLDNFRTTFPPIVLLSIVIVIWFSTRAIRKSLSPIDALMDGARQVAAQHFDYRVSVESLDEFQDLAASFNRMAQELNTHFKVITTRADLDRAILSVLDNDQIICTALQHMGDLFTFHAAGISVIDSFDTWQGRSFIHLTSASQNETVVVPFRLSSVEIQFFDQQQDWFEIADCSPAPRLLNALRLPESGYFVVLPIRIRNRLFAWVSLGMHAKTSFTQKDAESLRQFCNHLAVAFSNSNLIKELKELNLGTELALARTVDAKSSWTAGHSDRVNHLAHRIAAKMGWSAVQLEDLQRASLLHDIGKIGISRQILDKNGPLTDEEYASIKTHPSIGAKILSPIRVYAHILPVIEQHHERYDGKGYPFGLIGDQINLGARVLAVADSFDAMISDRPYRKGLELHKVLKIIHQESGRQFDPQVVEVFLKVVKE